MSLVTECGVQVKMETMDDRIEDESISIYDRQHSEDQ